MIFHRNVTDKRTDKHIRQIRLTMKKPRKQLDWSGRQYIKRSVTMIMEFFLFLTVINIYYKTPSSNRACIFNHIKHITLVTGSIKIII